MQGNKLANGSSISEHILGEPQVQITKLKICLAISVFLLDLLGVSCTGGITFAGVDDPQDFNSIQTTVSDSNTSDMVAVEDGAQSQNSNHDILRDSKAFAIHPTDPNDPNDPNLVTGRIIDQNTTEETPRQGLGFDSKRKGLPWTSSKMIAFYIVIGLAVFTIVVWLLLKRTLRTRLRMKKVTRTDLGDDTFLIVFNWTPKVLYFPTMIASVFALNLMHLQEADFWVFGAINPKIIGSIWFIIFFLNFLVEEYNITIIVILTSLLSVGFLLLWLNLVGWVGDFLSLFKHFALSISSTGYLLVSIIGLFTILISWLKGLFYYVTITPNYINLQEGPTETGEQIAREDYNTRVDTSNFLGRLLGFGKMVITFKDRKRQPITLLVGSIKRKARLLEEVRSKFVVERSD